VKLGGLGRFVVESGERPYQHLIDSLFAHLRVDDVLANRTRVRLQSYQDDLIPVLLARPMHPTTGIQLVFRFAVPSHLRLDHDRGLG
jgi:hypothetical protein